MKRFLFAVGSFGLCAAFLPAQTLSIRPEMPPVAAVPVPVAETSSIELTVPIGTPIKIALDHEVKVQKVGQAIHGKVVEPIYAFDQIVIPRGAEAIGVVSQIESVPKKTRTLAALDANFTPTHQVHITFNQIVLADGRQLPIDTTVSLASAGVLQFVSASARTPAEKEQAHKNPLSRNIAEAEAEAKREWNTAMQQLHEPGKVHKLERLAEAQSPLHHQYLDAGTAFDADLNQPLSFGSEQVSAEKLAGIASMPASGGVVHARLTTPLTSATAKKGDPVEAVLTEPLVVSNQLLLPVGSRLTGSVLEAHKARSLKRNGQLRILFHEVELPSGLEQKIESNLEGVEVSRGENLALDAEGGAQVTTPRTRYFVTAFQVALATSAFGDRDAGKASADGGGTGAAAANGASGFRLVGAVMSAVVHSRAVSSSFGFYGAGFSVYDHFITRGQDVVYPKDMSMVIGLGTR
ncbi:hypothetical protein Acid345_3120 [Candidatus Koribacter versatilis Ellin345]|uniref:Uncharacterized protein n=1 Tax=Koribacter versatilis (strain Ellin345) TaxID=204669 RepID=Q1ILX9_KORVE|nr:hypothetical protein [Candidatus Koribacter versatilis]ABF42121.1 hypothetical protein Acid345_3120 [Candidatus Koribacter versatilis Ellin345]